MTNLDKRIRAAQHRLWLDRWLELLVRCIAVAAGGVTVIVVVQRLFGLAWPLESVVIAVGPLALAASLIWLTATREDQLQAAAVLDQQAGLRERLSSGHCCRDSQDPFAQAVFQDADNACATLSVRSHMKLSWPRSLGYSVVAWGIAGLATLLPSGVLAGNDPAEEDDRRMQVQQARAAVKREEKNLREILPDFPELEKTPESEGPVDDQAGGAVKRPDDVRHEAVKRIDKLADAVKKRRDDSKHDAMSAVRKRFRGLKVPKMQDAPTRRLAKAMKQGDFKTAREEVKKLKEQLATLKSDEDKEMAAKLSAQLDKLAKQMDKLAEQKKLAAKLNKMGLSEEQAKRLLENLRKVDLDQLAKKLSKDGMDPKKIEQIKKELESAKQSNAMISKLASALKSASKAGAKGDGESAQSSMSMAEGQLSDMEAMESELAQLDSAAEALKGARSRIDKPCPSCNGTGMQGGQSCSRCNGQGGQGGFGGRSPGQGRGGNAPEERSKVSFKTERTKVHSGQGSIIGRFLVDGEQVPGEVSKSLSRVVSAAERDATDRVNRNRVPRQYQKAVKQYFSTVRGVLGGSDGESADPDAATADEQGQAADEDSNR